MRQRALPALLAVLCAAFLLLMSHHPLLAPLVVFFLSTAITVALWEFLEIAKKKYFDFPLSISLVFSFIYSFSVFYQTTHASKIPLAQIVFSVFVFLSFMLAFFTTKNAISNLSINIFAFVYVVMSLSKIIELLYQEQGVILVFYLLLTTKVCDTAAFFGGYFFGKTKIFPFLSPKKTLEGAIAGILGSMALSFFFVLVLPLSFSRLLILSFFMALFAQAGDLAESLIKRDAEVKDSNQIPGLGGILDIFDSLIFTSPFLSFIYSLGLVYDYHH